MGLAGGPQVKEDTPALLTGVCQCCNPANWNFGVQDCPPCAPFSPPNEECDLSGPCPSREVYIERNVRRWWL